MLPPAGYLALNDWVTKFCFVLTLVALYEVAYAAPPFGKAYPPKILTGFCKIVKKL